MQALSIIHRFIECMPLTTDEGLDILHSSIADKSTDAGYLKYTQIQALMIIHRLVECVPLATDKMSEVSLDRRTSLRTHSAPGTGVGTDLNASSYQLRAARD